MTKPKESIDLQPPTAARRLLVHHVADRLGVARTTVRYWARNGHLPAFKVGPKIWYFKPADVELLKARRELRWI